MSTTIRKIPGVIALRAVEVCNASRLDALNLRAGAIFHASATTAITLADITAGSTLPVQVAFVAAISAAYVEHIASACDATTGIGAHRSADATNVITTPAGTDLATCYARANEIKALHNVHVASAVFHPVADTGHTTTAPDATTAGTLATLANELKADLSGHFAAAFTATATVIGPA